MDKIRVLCMFGGRSTEYEVSLMSAYSILSNIDREKYEVMTLGVTKDGKWLYYEGGLDGIKDGSWHTREAFPALLVPDCGAKKLLVLRDTPEYKDIDVVFPIMHGANCEDGTLQGLFEICGIPYVGPGCLSSAVSMDKVFTKLVLNNYGIPQAEFLHFTDTEVSAEIDSCVAKTEEKFDYPVFVKPANAGSSIGTGKARDRAGLASALVNAAKFDSKIIVEEYITAKEIEVAVMGKGDTLRTSVCGEIIPGADYYDYETKYISDVSSDASPARIPAETAETVRALAAKIYTALGCKGLSRVDFFVTDGGRIVFNEINTLPGFTTISMYPKLFLNEGMTYSEIIDSLIELAINE